MKGLKNLLNSISLNICITISKEVLWQGLKNDYPRHEQFDI